MSKQSKESRTVPKNPKMQIFKLENAFLDVETREIPEGLQTKIFSHRQTSNGQTSIAREASILTYWLRGQAGSVNKNSVEM